MEPGGSASAKPWPCEGRRTGSQAASTGGRMGVRVAVAGASGYAGGELLRLIETHPDLELGPVTGDASAGAGSIHLHPHQTSLAGLRFEPTVACPPGHGPSGLPGLQPEESAAIAARLPDGAAVIDLSAGFRLADPADWAAFYAGPHACPGLDGLPELPGARDRIRAARQVAAPGCHATAVILALAPLLAAGLADPADIVAVAASGTSGAGRSPRPGLLATEVLGAVSAYQVGGVHRHTPEIEQALGEVTGTRPTVSSPRCWCRCRAASWPPARPGRRAAQCRPTQCPPTQRPPTQWPPTRAPCSRTPTRASRSSGCCRTGSGPAPRPPSAATRCTCKPPRTRTPAGGARRRRRGGQPGQGGGRAGHPDRQPDAGACRRGRAWL